MDDPFPETTVTRRGFLGLLAGSLAAALGAAAGSCGLAYFLSPAFSREKDEWVDIAGVDDIPLGAPTEVKFTQRRRDAWLVAEGLASTWVLTRDRAHFIAYDPHCTHLGCPYRWSRTRNEFLCPCHGGVFSMDGKVLAGPPPRPLDRYPTKVEAGRLLVIPLPARGMR
ncbi:MAG: ubiquinol-cytochrome c reductase iron-sulfur subunit [Elusimicrobia bacterium]|nr:ubiquinol-cytochrome c reductase iron-sulfur subunit [Elusimicrobiota bacterium]